MVLDQVENFIRVSVAGGHALDDTTISLESGEASSLPAVTQGKYNLIWWDSENFSLPSEDPNVEIVRVNSINTSNDTISVTRGRENTGATSKDSSTGEYSLILGPTAKTIKDIDSTKLDASAYSPEADTHARYSDSEARGAINGSVIEPEQAIHSRSIDSSLTLSSDQGLVLAGPVSGSGSISGEGSFVVTDNQLGESEVVNLIQSQSIDADTLDGVDSTGFIQTSDAIDADTLDGVDSTGFIQTSDTIDADTLDGIDSTGFIQTSDTIDADTLDGLDASQLGIDVSNNASTIVSNATDINFSSGLTASDDTDGTSTVSLDSISHDSLTNIGSSDHHSKTTSASELTDVSADSISNAHHSRYSDSEARSALDGSNPQFGSAIGFNNDSTVISHNDSNDESGSLYSGVDGITFNGDGNISGIALISGYIRASEGLESDGAVHSENGYQTNNFEVVENSSTNSLDFNYTG